ncbi:hypothetical protein BJ508DRAFT_329325 [Ascobolus immersus RN42]|uniref:F-box domain-containing protein n=1 Tax=Ascobolus immersus RN42 TaxID=1160509 RepID=A0A3N4I9B0_ASCIM|nr:hypothetical protein BJ508DRAFT_329325 [Ascobolus immersus RN42]
MSQIRNNTSNTMSNTTNPLSNQRHFRLFSLPPELRLLIYRQCTSVTLLNLSHANRRLREDVKPGSVVYFRLFALPPELRLSIYRQCTAFTLLNLSLANRQLRGEINNEPAIKRSSYGYKPRNIWEQTHSLAPIAASQPQQYRNQNVAILVINHAIQALRERNLCLFNINELASWDEVVLLLKRRFRQRPGVLMKMCYYCWKLFVGSLNLGSRDCQMAHFRQYDGDCAWMEDGDERIYGHAWYDIDSEIIETLYASRG